MKVKDIVQEGVFDRLGKAFTGDLNAQARELRKQQRDQERQQAQQHALNPQVDQEKLNPSLRTNPQRTAPAVDRVAPVQLVPAPPKGKVGLVDVGHGPDSQAYFKSSSGRWYTKFTQGTEFATTHPVTNPKDIESLEKIAHDAGLFTIPVIPNPKGPTNSYITDPKHIRATRLAQARSQRGKL